MCNTKLYVNTKYVLKIYNMSIIVECVDIEYCHIDGYVYTFKDLTRIHRWFFTEENVHRYIFPIDELITIIDDLY